MYRSILVPVDLDQPNSWAKALSTAVALCRCFGASLTLAAVVPDTQLTLDAQWSAIACREIIATAEARLAALAASVTGAGEVAHRVEAGAVAGTIVAIAERAGTDLIVLASHRPAMTDVLLGSTAARVVRHARCSVMVVRA